MQTWVAMIGCLAILASQVGVQDGYQKTRESNQESSVLAAGRSRVQDRSDRVAPIIADAIDSEACSTMQPIQQQSIVRGCCCSQVIFIDDLGLTTAMPITSIPMYSSPAFASPSQPDSGLGSFAYATPNALAQPTNNRSPNVFSMRPRRPIFFNRLRLRR